MNSGAPSLRESPALQPDQPLAIELRNHAGIKAYPLAADIEAEAYRLMRERHAFLTDDNHTWEIRRASVPGCFSGVRVVKNERSSWFVWKPSWADDGPGAFWFSQDFRVVTPAILLAEAEELAARAADYQAKAAGQRDSIRGRKEAKRLKSIAEEFERQRRVLHARWPQIVPSPSSRKDGASPQNTDQPNAQ